MDPHSLQWRHNEHDGVSNHRRLDYLLNRLFRRRLKKTSKLRVTGLCEGNSSVTGEFPAQRVNNAENIFIWWRHHYNHKKTEHKNTVCIFNEVYCKMNLQGDILQTLYSAPWLYLYWKSGSWYDWIRHMFIFIIVSFSRSDITRYFIVLFILSEDRINLKLSAWIPLPFIKYIMQMTFRKPYLNIVQIIYVGYHRAIIHSQTPHQPPVILSGTLEQGWAPLTCGCWQINSILANIGRRNSIRILNQYPFWWNIWKRA